MASPDLHCPSCAGERIWKDGIRYTRQGEVQRYLCRSCGYRFSETLVKVNILGEFGKTFHSGKGVGNLGIGAFDLSLKKQLDGSPLGSGENITSHGALPNLTSVAKPLKALPCYSSKHRVCVSETKGAKNLVKVETRTQKRAAGATKLTEADVKGKIVDFSFWMLKQGYREASIKGRTKILKLLAKRGADIFDPESVKKVIAQQNTWSEGTKANAVGAYSCFLAMHEMAWNPPRYRKNETLPFIPTEAEINQLIASCGKVVSIYLEGLKETGADPGEFIRVRWIDVNKEASTISINHPVKRHRPRIISVSRELIGRLDTLPKKSERVFNVFNMYPNYYVQRKTAAKKFNNPRLLKITFVTLRHWKGTMEYHRTKDILHVMKLLGHKQIQNTLIYINLENAVFNDKRNDEFTVRVAHDVDEACRLVESGFEYVTDMNEQKIFRKRK